MKYRATAGQHGYEVAVREEQGSLIVELEGTRHSLEVLPYLGRTHFRVQVDGVWHLVTVRREDNTLLVGLEENQYRVHVERLLPIPARAAQTSSGIPLEVKAPMPGVVMAIEVVVGAWVEHGAPIVIMEAMKMQMEIRAPAAGRVVSIRTQPGQEVAGGAALVALDPTNPPSTGVRGG